MNYAIEQRMRFIDFVLTHYGYITRPILCDYFGIASACATRDIREYLKMNGGNVFYNVTTKKYMTTNDFVAYYE